MTTCGWQRGTVECRGDGYLWDADSDGYDPNDFSEPCPACNTEAFLRREKEDAESTSEWSFMAGGYRSSGTGADIWISACKTALAANPEQAGTLIKRIGPVHALVPADNDEGAAVEIITHPGDIGETVA